MKLFTGLEKTETKVFEDGSAQCNICGKSFGRKDSCARHITHVHGESNNSGFCDCSYCGKVFKNLQSLKTHLRGVHGIYSSK